MKYGCGIGGCLIAGVVFLLGFLLVDGCGGHRQVNGHSKVTARVYHPPYVYTTWVPATKKSPGHFQNHYVPASWSLCVEDGSEIYVSHAEWNRWELGQPCAVWGWHGCYTEWRYSTWLQVEEESAQW